MSHFIQDNQIVIKTVDNWFLLLIKGGDNNCYSMDNKRVTSWHLHASFQNEEQYQAYITQVIMSDISGGSWQFNSLKNKSFTGFTQYEYTVYNRFDKALKTALLLTDWKISDVTAKNIYSFEQDILSLMRSYNLPMKNESGIEASSLKFMWSYKDDITKEECGLNFLQKEKQIQLDEENKDYKSFCSKYHDKNVNTLINDIEFCSKFVEFNLTCKDSISLLKSVSNNSIGSVDYACFNILIFRNKKTLFNLLNTYYIDSLLETYPTLFQTINCIKTFHSDIKDIINEQKQKDKDYYSKKFEENYMKIVNADYTSLIAIKKTEQEKLLSNAKSEFIDTWNDLIDTCFYKQTNTRLTDRVNKLRKHLDTNTFTLEDIKTECNNNFIKVIDKHEHQYKKNQVVIKKVFKDLINEYYVLFDENSIDTLCDYFGYKKPLLETEITKEVVVKQIEESNVVSKIQPTLFDFAA